MNPEHDRLDDRPRELTTARLPLLRLEEEAGRSPGIPERYRIRENDDGRVLICIEAPTLEVEIERGQSVPATSARNADPGTIFLDGAAKAPPFLDLEGGVINFDHHEGCVRAFTLSACEQAFVAVSKGLDLHSREWRIVANEPDLDTVLAIWVLLNHRRIRNGSRPVLQRLVPLLRLEGVIDVHGFDLRHFTGLPAEAESATFAQLEQLRAREAELREQGLWGETDPLEYTLDRLQAIDAQLYRPEDFEGHEEIEELARAELPDQKLVIACRSPAGIYRVEEKLKEVYGERLGILLLEKEPDTYTLRQARSFSRSNLERAYERLNLIDPAAGNRRSSERWGGSNDIGGSPRGRGSRLDVREIVEAVRDASTPLSAGQRLGAVLGAAIASLGGALLAALPLIVLHAEHPDTLGPDRAVLHAGALLLVAALLSAAATWRGPGPLGLRPPAGRRWLLALPVALVGGVLGGSWVATAGGVWATILLILGIELLLRGAVFGVLLEKRAGHRGPHWTSPVLVTTVLYALITVFGQVPFVLPWELPLPETLTRSLGALLFGLALGWARERSESLLAPLLLHALTATAILAWA